MIRSRRSVSRSKLLLVNGIATLAAGIVLFAGPGWIPGVVGIHVEPSAYLLCYLLGAAELALAGLCFLARGLADDSAQRAVVLTCVIFHTTSAIGEVVAFIQGAKAVIWLNVALRALMVVLFLRYGLHRKRPRST
jgi:hypothetical protein